MTVESITFNLIHFLRLQIPPIQITAWTKKTRIGTQWLEQNLLCSVKYLNLVISEFISIISTIASTVLDLERKISLAFLVILTKLSIYFRLFTKNLRQWPAHDRKNLWQKKSSFELFNKLTTKKNKLYQKSLQYIRLIRKPTIRYKGSTTTDRDKLTANKLNNSNWMRRAMLKIFYYPQSHLAQTLTLWRNHCNEAVGLRSVCSRSVDLARLQANYEIWNSTCKFSNPIQVFHLRCLAKLEEIETKSMNAINCFWHVFTVVNISGFGVENLQN